ncbi:MAG: citrate synthase [Actinobacteria bacterium]|nr:MAG: citrate synthase [Actinomycetota bacterium]
MAPRGLEGVVATTTAISSVSDNFLQYRGYRIEELVGKAEYEEVAYLLLNGDLPNKNELRDFKAELTKHRTLSPFLREILRQMSESGTPMDVLRTVISASAVEDPGEGDNSHEAEYRKAIRLTAKLPTVLATYIRRRRGEQPVTPDPTLGHASNFARMAGLDEAHPRAAEILNACFILQAEHGLNTSTFAARITAATLADMHAAVTAGLSALKGPLHGGATDGTMKMLDEIGTTEHVDTWVAKAIASKYKFSGFGHRVFAAIAKARPSMSPAAAEKVYIVNVDFYAATTYTFLGIPADLGTSIFAVGRMAGWCAHIMEQHGDNRLIRPESEYTGPTGKRWVPIAER